MMTLYDSCILSLEQFLSSYPFRRSSGEGGSWPDAGKNQLIFSSDSAYELGGGTLPAISGIALTSDKSLIPCDEILLCGDDLPQLKQDAPYARMTLIRIREEAMGEGNALYQSIRKIEYTRYHVNPRGYMMRISAINQRESVRIGREALAEGLNFSQVGQLFVQAYHQHPAVEAVKLLFITQPNFPYAELSRISERSENITKALDHLLKNVKMDCNVCNLKEICAEVEQLCQTDFAKKKNSMAEARYPSVH